MVENVATKQKLKLKCPICKKPVVRHAGDFPFCSERCRLIDLGKWASGGYVISTPIDDPEMISEAEYREALRKKNGSDDDEHGEDFKGSRRPQ